MTDKLKSSPAKVQAFLSSHGYPFTVREMPGSTRTAKDAATAVGCTVSQIAKSLIFKERRTGEPILVVASGTNRVSIEKVEQATGLQLSKADADFVREKVGYAIGGVPPVAHQTSVKTILDQDLLQFDSIWAAAGSPHSVFELTPRDLGAMTQGEWIDLAQ